MMPVALDEYILITEPLLTTTIGVSRPAIADWITQSTKVTVDDAVAFAPERQGVRGKPAAVSSAALHTTTALPCNTMK
jgi:hypothetical protein